MSRRRTVLLAAGAAVAVVLTAVVAGWYAWAFERPDTDRLAGEVVVRIPAGATSRAVADTLAAHGLLEHPAVFRWGARLDGLDRRLRAGSYSLPADATPRELVRLLTSGPVTLTRVTVPEGADAETVGRLVAASFAFSDTVFLDAADALVTGLLAAEGWLPEGVAPDDYAAAVAAQRGPGRRRICEGYLFPETYRVAADLDAAAVASVLVGSAAKAVREAADRPRDERSAGLTPHELLTLASVVEAETPRTGEMPRVAAVYLNRLREGRRLEADPTVAFATRKKGRRILYADLEVDSDYNTYRIGGLPPGPIGSAGGAAVAAVAAPDADADVYFFVADGRGGHVFSRTLAEHQAAVRNYRRLRDARSP